MQKKKLIIIITSILLVLGAIGAGAYFFLQNKNTDTPVKPAPTETAPTFEEEQESAWNKIEEDERYQETITKYSQYLNQEESIYGDLYQGANVIPGLYAVGNYVEKGFFNPYFVSDFWQTRDNYTPNSLDSYLGEYLTDSFKESLLSIPHENLDNRIFIPDASLGIPVGCAEEWIEYDCFTTPPTIQKITVKGMNRDTAIFTVQFVMDVNYQAADMPVGSYLKQQRNYSVDFTVVNTNPGLENLEFTDIKIDNIATSLDISNTIDTAGEQP